LSDRRTFRAAIFDLDGTLIDSYDAIHASLNHVLAAFERSPVSREEVRRMVGRGLPSLIERALGPASVDAGVELFRRHYEVAAPASTRPLAGAEEVTAELRRRGVPMAVASNKPGVFCRQLLSGLGLADRFVAVLGPDDGYPPKPAPEMVHAALEALGSERAKTLFVGDMPIDVETARAAGLSVAVVPTGSSTREELEAARPDHLLARLEDVLAFFS